MRISDWSSDVCSSDLACATEKLRYSQFFLTWRSGGSRPARRCLGRPASAPCHLSEDTRAEDWLRSPPQTPRRPRRSEEHTSELQSLMRNSYAVFCLKKKNNNITMSCNIHTQTLQLIATPIR